MLRHRATPVTSRALSARLLAVACTALLALGVQSSHADTATWKGPAPTTASIEARGPFTLGTAKLPSSPAYGSATTVYHPTDRSVGRYGLVVLCPGFVSSASLYSGIAQQIASHGFVVAVVSTRSLFDQPKARGEQLVAVMNAVTAQNSVQAVPYAGLVDTTRVAFMGHSAGGAGTFYAAATHPELKALVGLMAGEPSTNLTPFAGIRIPTLVLTAENDALANSWSKPYYQSLDGSYPATWVELAGANHLSLWTTASATSQGRVGKYALAWVKRFLDEDTRYTPFVRTKSADLSNFGTKGSF
jgi:dienelactone hydrolase